MADEPNPPPPASDDLSATAASAPADAPRIYRADGRRHDGATPLRVETYDFRNPVVLAEAELRRLRVSHADFTRYLSARLALFLRMECTLKPGKISTLTYNKFTEGLPGLTHLCLFKAEPLNGVGILDISPRLALTLVDRMLGGRGHSVKVERPLTEIEIALLEDILRIVLEEWCGQWRNERELQPAIIGHENNGRYLQTSPRDAIMATFAIEFEFGDCHETVQLAVPFYTIEPLVKAVQARRNRETTATRPPASGEWKEIYHHIALPACAEWDAFELSLRELTRLRVGDVLPLPASIVDRTRVCLAGVPKFNGTVGLEGERVVVKISEKLKPEENSHAHTH